MLGAAEKSYRFEGFTLDLRWGFLRGAGGENIELRRQSFEVLRYLVENAGRLVPKDELVKTIWQDAIVGDGSLTQCISDVRKALGDCDHRIIATVSGRGYVFQAPVAPAFSKEASPSPAPLNGRAAPSEVHRPAERRQLTILACEWMGLASLSAQLDPEDLESVLAACHAHCADIIRRYNGYVAHHLDEGVVAYFGYPEAHEHDAEHAVRAGLALREPVAFLANRFGRSLQLRIGVASGLVVIGSEIAAGAVREQAIGDTPTLAHRLRDAADTGSVLIAQSTHRLVGRLFEYRSLDAVAVKGFAEPVKAYEVLGASKIDSRFDARRDSPLTPLVGREEELELLQRRWRQAQGGEGRVVLVSGEPGIGKSRLITALEEWLQAAPHTRVRYFCSPHHQDSALYPSVKQLERAAGFRRDDTDEQKLAKLEAVLAPPTGKLREAVPVLADLLSLPTGDRYPAIELAPRQRKEKTLRAQLAQIERLAARQPVLILYEDVQWSDPTTRESLDLLIERLPTLRALLLLSFRPEFAPPWIGRPHVTLISLSRLSPRQCAEMIIRVTGGKSLPNEIADQIADRTDGVPLFIEELTKAVVESGLLVDSGDSYRVTGRDSPPAIPTSLQASLLARLDRLASSRDVVQIAAAIGRRFSHELIHAVAAAPQQQLDDALAQLVQAELIYQRGTPPEAEYTFKHALVRDAAYSTLLRKPRQQLHARIVATLERQFPEIVVAEPAWLAQHCVEAGLAEKAVGYWLKAGRQALARSAMTEASVQLRKGLDVLAGTPDSAWRQQQELDLQIALRRALVFTNGFAAPAVGEATARARSLANQIARPEYLVRLTFGQWSFHMARAEYRLALELAQQIEKIGEASNDVWVQLRGLRANGVTHLYLGEFVTARALLARCHGLGDAAHDGPNEGRSEALCAEVLASLAVTLAYLGYVDQARARINQALSEARRLKHAETLAHVLHLASRIEWVMCSSEQQGHAEELLALSTEHGFSFYSGFAMASRGHALAALGKGDEALAQLTQGQLTLRAIGAVASTTGMLMGLAKAHTIMCQPVDALNCLAEAARFVYATDERDGEAELYRLRGDVLNTTGDPSAGEQNYHQAIQIAKRQSAKLYELRASISLARLWRNQGKRAEARNLLAPIYGWFTEGRDSPDLEAAKALLEALAQ